MRLRFLAIQRKATLKLKHTFFLKAHLYAVSLFFLLTFVFAEKVLTISLPHIEFVLSTKNYSTLSDEPPSLEVRREGKGPSQHVRGMPACADVC